MRIDRRWRPLIVIAAAAAITISGCGSSSSGSGTTPTPAPTSASTGGATTGGEATSGQTPSACADIVAKGQALATAGAGLVNGSASRDQVSAAAQDLNTAIANAKAELTPAIAAHANDVQTDIGKLTDALKAQPMDIAGVKAAAGAIGSDLGDLASVCGTPTTAAPTS